LLRAMHEWMVDNGLTPHIVVAAEHEGVQAPDGLAQGGRIVFNVSHAATRGLSLGNEVVSFEARFGGVPRKVEVPIAAVLGIYARETGQGMVFSDEGPPSDLPSPPQAPDGGGRAKLKVVK
jgi:stringent starvation protein B